MSTSVLMRLLERLLLRRSEVWRLEVRAATRLTPHMLRVEFEGRDLQRFATDENLHVRLLLPPEGAPRKDWLPRALGGRAGKPAAPPVYRKYTIRAIDPAAHRLSIDFVLHGDAGPGSAWAERAQPSDVVGMIGPGGRGIRPADWHLIAGDETALPAIGRILESLPTGARGAVFIEIADAAEEQPLKLRAGMTLRWLHRDGAPAGTTPLLPDALRDVAFPHEGSVFVWAAAEHRAISIIRAQLRRDRQLDKSSHLAVAYWRRDEAERDGS